MSLSYYIRLIEYMQEGTPFLAKLNFQKIFAKVKLNPVANNMGGSGVRCPAGQTMGKYNSKIRREIERWLNHIKNPDGPSLFIRLFMIGRKGEKTNPAIMICCASRETSKIFEASVRNSGILDRYPGLQLSSCALPPDARASLVPRPLFDNGCRNGDPNNHALNGITSKVSTPDAVGMSGPRMGRRLEFMVSSGEGLRLQHATGGLIIRIGEELYQITSFDSMGSMKDSNWASKSSRDPEKYEVDNQSEAEDSGYEQVFSSEKSLLLETATGRDEKASFYGQHPLPCKIICSPLEVDGGGVERSLMWNYQDVPFTTPTSLNPSPASCKQNSHYNLVKLSDLESSEASNVVLGGDGQIPPKLEALDVSRVGTEPISVLVVTPRGPVSATALPEVASCRLGGSSKPQTVHAVILSEPMVPGDHGSAVIDISTGSCYGHVVHGVEGDVVCYMVPAPDTLADIVLNLGRLPSLQLDRRTDTKHASTVERWKCVNPRENVNCHPLAPLGKCTSCRSGKLYRARSRAAAHLRKNHFPKETASQGDNGRREDDVKQNRLPATELKKWTREITVTPLYARVMQAESDSESDYDDDVDDTDDELENEPPSATSTSIMTDQQANLETENEKLRHDNEEMRHEIEVLAGDIDVLMEDREELKQELEHLRKRLREQEESLTNFI